MLHYMSEANSRATAMQANGRNDGVSCVRTEIENLAARWHPAMLLSILDNHDWLQLRCRKDEYGKRCLGA